MKSLHDEPFVTSMFLVRNTEFSNAVAAMRRGPTRLDSIRSSPTRTSFAKVKPATDYVAADDAEVMAQPVAGPIASKAQ